MLTEGQKKEIRNRISLVFKAIETKQNELDKTPNSSNRVLNLNMLSKLVSKYSDGIEPYLIQPETIFAYFMNGVQHACVDYEAQISNV